MQRNRAAWLVAIFAQLACFHSALAEDYPTRPIRMIVPYAVGGNTDLVARLIAKDLGQAFHQDVVVDNRPGGNTVVGSSVTAHAAPDGYTIMLVTLSLAVNPSVYRHLPYDTLKDFTPITLAVTEPNVLIINPALPASSVSELIAYAKANPGKLNFSESGVATSPDLSLRLFNVMAGLNIVTVPFKGGAPAMTAVISGQVQGQFVGLPAAIPYIRSKQVRALAITSPKRGESVPDLPALDETLPGYEADNWFAVVGPAAMPDAIVKRLQSEISRVLQAPGLHSKLLELGAQPVGSTSAELAALLRRDIDKYAKVVKDTGIPVQ